jgi:hypothetical protein
MCHRMIASLEGIIQTVDADRSELGKNPIGFLQRFL